MPQPQLGVIATENRAVIFLVVAIGPGAESAARVRSVCGTVDALVRAVGARDQQAFLSCVTSIGSEAWDRLLGSPRPAELHPFRELHSGNRHAPATPGDVLFHIRSERDDLCFELAAQLMTRLGESVQTVDEVHGFRYFDDRDLIGFVDGTENPAGEAERSAATLVGAEDPAFAGGSYVVVQRYVHDLGRWNALPVERQEQIIGRTKLDDIELDPKPSFAHNALTVLEEDGTEIPILRHNMPYGLAGPGESGTYFIGYARSPRPIEQMLENMVIGRPPGNYDRLLDFTHPVTGTNFFAPSMPVLTAMAAADAPEPLPPSADGSGVGEAGAPRAGRRDGSLGIGSLKGVPQYE